MSHSEAMYLFAHIVLMGFYVAWSCWYLQQLSVRVGRLEKKKEDAK